MKKFLLPFLLISLLNAAHAQTLMSGMPTVAGSIYGIYPIGDTVYIFGSFSQVNGQPRQEIASFNLKTGAVTSFSHSIYNIQSVTRVGSKLVVGGMFFDVDSQERYSMCIFDLATGNLDSWHDTIYVDATRGVGVEGNDFYFGKYVTGSGSGIKIAKANAVTGVTASWLSDSMLYGHVYSMLVTSNYVYVGGKFYFHSGGDTSYDNLCRFHKSTGALDTSWRPAAWVGSWGVQSIVENNGRIYVGGLIAGIKGQLRANGLAEFDANGNLTGFNPVNSSNEVHKIFALGENLWVVSNASTLGGVLRWRIAEINIKNQTATCWNASAVTNSWSVGWDVFVRGDTVFAANTTGTVFIFTGSPRPHYTANAITGPTTVAPLQTATYSVPNTGGVYSWKIIGGTGSSTTNSVTVNWGNGPTGVIKMVDHNTSLTNCNSDTVYLTVNVGTVGMEDISSLLQINIFPNPATDEITVETGTTGSSFKVCDVTGNLVLISSSLNENFEIDLRSFPRGMYFLSVTHNDKEVHKRFIKE